MSPYARPYIFAAAGILALILAPVMAFSAYEAALDWPAVKLTSDFHNPYEMTAPRLMMMLKYQAQSRSELPEDLAFLKPTVPGGENFGGSVIIEKDESLWIASGKPAEIKSHRVTAELKAEKIDSLPSACSGEGCSLTEIPVRSHAVELKASGIPAASNQRGAGLGFKAEIEF